MATYVNDLRLTELATGEGSGSWGTTTNVSLELIGEALGYATQQVFGSDADATTTIADGASDPARAMYFKITSAGSLTATRTCTIAPNTVSRVMFIENATTGSQSIAISQGSGANVTIATGKTAVVYLDGAGSGAAVVDAMAGVDPGVTDTLAEVLTAGNTTGGTDIVMSAGDNITNASGDLTLDIVGDIILDADGGDFKFRDGGAGFFTISNSSLDAVLKVEQSDEDFIIKGNDGGSEITALTLDMSAAGAAAFNAGITTGGNVVVGGTLSANSLTIDDITINSSTISDAGNLTIDSGGDITLDQGGGDLIISDDGTIVGTISVNSSDFKIRSRVSDKDLIFQGNDGGSEITALTLDMSAAGAAIFNDQITLAGNLVHAGNFTIDAGGDITLDADGSDIYLKDGGSERYRFRLDATPEFIATGGNFRISNATSDADILFVGDDGGSAITALTLDMSEAGAATFNAGIIIPDFIYHAGDTHTYFGFQGGDQFELDTGGANRMRVVGSEVAFNDDGGDKDFRVESDGNTHMLFVEAASDCVSIGTSSDKGAALNIEGNIRRGSYTTLSNFNSNNDVIAFNYNIAPSASTVTPIYSGSTNAGGSFINMEAGGGGTLDFRAAKHGTDAAAFTYTDTGKYLTMLPTAKAEGVLVVNQDGNANIDFRVESDTNTNALFVDASSNRVGIFTASPSEALHVTGRSRINSLYLGEVSGSTDIIQGTSGNLYLTSTGSNLTLGSGAAIFNEASADLDFRVESNGNANMLFVDANNNRVGVGTNFPSYEFVVSKDGSSGIEFGPEGINDTTSFIQFYNRSTAAYDTARLYMKSLDLYLEAAQVIALQISTTEAVINQSGADLDFRVESDANANAIFMNAANGTVAFGASTPQTATNFIGAGGVYINNGNQPSGDFMSIDAEGASGGTSMTFYRYDSSATQYQNRFTIAGETSETVVNDTGLDVDFRVESDTNANAIFMDASTSYVGINRTPAVELDVQRISTSYPLRISAADGSARTMVFADSAGSPSRVNWLAGAQYNTDNGWELTPSTANGGYTFTNRILTAYANGDLTVNENGISADFRVESDGNAHAFFVDASTADVYFGASSTTYPTGANFVHINEQGGVSMTVGGHSGTHTAIQFRHNGTATVGSIVVTSSSTTYNTSSDYRLKENITNADDAGSKIDAIQVRQYDWKVDGSHQDYGMVAQELNAVAPEAVLAPEDPDEMMGVDYSKLVPMLIKEIQSLRARVADLES